MGDGAYLVNCSKGDDRRSAVAFYNNVKLGGGNDNEQPNAFQYVSFGSFTSWEGHGSATFNTGITMTWDIGGTAESNRNHSVGDKVGTASNGFEGFNIFKDSGAFMFTNGDGFQCHKIYFVFH